MSSYILYLVTSILFYTAGIIMVVNSNRSTGIAFIALGCTFFTLALNRRKKQK